jgi:hypothetical protein
VLTILDEEFAPTTSAAGYVGAPLAQVVQALTNWHEELYGSADVMELQGGIRAALPFLQPLKLGSPCRWALVDMGGWTAFFDNFLRGIDPIPPMSVLARRLGVTTVAVTSIPHTVGLPGIKQGRTGAVRFNMFGPLKTDFINYVRTVSCIFDGARWVFHTHGTEQPFEEIERYAAPRVRDRFTSDMLSRYCAALELFPFDLNAYGELAAIFRTEHASQGAPGA